MTDFTQVRHYLGKAEDAYADMEEKHWDDVRKIAGLEKLIDAACLVIADALHVSEEAAHDLIVMEYVRPKVLA